MSPFLQFQIDLIYTLQHAGSWLIAIMKGFTFLGDEEFFMLILPLLYWCIDSRLGFRIGAMLLYSNAFTSALKMTFHTPRPSWISTKLTPHVHEAAFGLPSGHSANAASVWGLLGASIRKKWLTIVVVICIIGIGFSRMAVGAHLLIDVLSGWTVGLIYLFVFLKIEKPIEAWLKKLDLKQKFFAAFLSTMIMVIPAFLAQRTHFSFIIPPEWIQNAGYEIAPFSLEGMYTISGTWAGICFGAAWFNEKHGVFCTDGSFSQKAIRYFSGLIGVLILWFGLKMIFPSGETSIAFLFRFIRYALVGLWVSCLAPLLFLRFNLARSNK